jgi:acetylornithine deacetylase/succinyl-diaminopimelate desuccinylase-like protein
MAFLLTSDEEGPATTAPWWSAVNCRRRGERLDCCIVGEPTSVERTGDMIKNGRRGTMSGKLTVKGVQGHIAYPHLARNPIHLFAPALAELAATLGRRQRLFPAHHLAGQQHPRRHGASNVIPGTVVVDFNFRFSTESTAEGLQQRVADILARHGLQAGPITTWPGPSAACPSSPARHPGGRGARGHPRRNRHRDRTVHHRRHQRRALHRPDLPAGDRARPPNATIHKVNDAWPWPTSSR